MDGAASLILLSAPKKEKAALALCSFGGGVFVFTRLFVCVFTHLFVCVYILMSYRCVCLSLGVFAVTCPFVCVCLRSHACVCMFTCLCVCVCICLMLHLCVCVCVCVCVYICVYTHESVQLVLQERQWPVALLYFHTVCCSSFNPLGHFSTHTSPSW